MAGDRVSVGSDALRIVLDRHAGKYRCRAGGGVWLGRGVSSGKLAEMAQGGFCVRDADLPARQAGSKKNPCLPGILPSSQGYIRDHLVIGDNITFV